MKGLILVMCLCNLCLPIYADNCSVSPAVKYTLNERAKTKKSETEAEMAALCKEYPNALPPIKKHEMVYYSGGGHVTVDGVEYKPCCLPWWGPSKKRETVYHRIENNQIMINNFEYEPVPIDHLNKATNAK